MAKLIKNESVQYKSIVKFKKVDLLLLIYTPSSMKCEF